MFKIISKHFRYRWEKFYSKNLWHLLLDLSLLTIIIILICVIIGLNFYHPETNLSDTGNTLKNKATIDLNNPPLEFSATLASTSLSIKEGTFLKLSFKNNGDSPITALKFNLKAITKNFNINRVELVDNNNSDISVKGSELSPLDLPAGLRGELSLKVYFDSKNDNGKEIDWQMNVSYSVAGQSLTATVDLPQVHLASVLKVESRAYYNSPQGDQLGAGPLPPLVGLPTNYWIFLEANSDGDFNNFIYSAKLPKGVEWTGNLSILAGELDYNKDSRQIIWRIPLIEAGLSDYRASFELQLIPTADQTGKILPFLSGAKYSAQEINGAKIKINEQSNIPDADLEYDTINKGQGKIAN